MKSFRNNRRGRYRNNDRNFKRTGETQKFNSDFTSNSSFKRKSPGRNNHNASKLIEKYNDLAREALSNGDKILSENYFQHADHFTRILAEQASIRSLNENARDDNSNQKNSKIEIVSDNTKIEENK